MHATAEGEAFDGMFGALFAREDATWFNRVIIAVVMQKKEELEVDRDRIVDSVQVAESRIEPRRDGIRLLPI